ncbi:hypothetical protein [Tritonibacter multivorans]|uniref:hypothetical protein n=1 Tax=Tritonibacter multivorans TaxID=928856 RepID=UPI0010416D69|nr:hypothetical protein [Tritonibacter multivorans]MDA7422264.1 hypothetical protein [Tritonibacter multivorans]
MYRNAGSAVLPDPTLEDLTVAGALEPLQVGGEDCAVAHVQILDMAGFRIGLCYSDDEFFQELAPIYAHVTVPEAAWLEGATPTEAWITVSRHKDGGCVAARGGDPRLGRADAVAPLLKLALTDVLLDLIDPLLLHAAVVAVRTATQAPAAMLIVGDPGAGKSTLAMSLARAGCHLCGDDLALLGWDGAVQAVPFPATLKTGSWALFSGQDTSNEGWPLAGQIEAARSYLRPDAQHVRYLPLSGGEGDIASAALPVRWVVFLDRVPGPVAQPEVTPLDVPEVLSRMIAASWSGTEELDPAEFRALAACLDKAHCFAFRYSDLDPAVSTLMALADRGDQEPMPDDQFPEWAQGA